MVETVPADVRLDGVFHALADPTRRAILARLVRRPATVTALAEPFAISLPAVSKHLKVLERARLISRDIDGRQHLCSLEPSTLRDVEEWLGPYRTFWTAHFEALARALPTNSDPGNSPDFLPPGVPAPVPRRRRNGTPGRRRAFRARRR